MSMMRATELVTVQFVFTFAIFYENPFAIIGAARISRVGKLQMTAQPEQNLSVILVFATFDN